MKPDREQVLEHALAEALDLVYAPDHTGTYLPAEKKLNAIAAVLLEALDTK